MNAQTHPGTQRTRTAARRLVVAHPDAVFVRQVYRQLAGLGWDVHPAASGQEARRLARLLSPAVVVLAAEFSEESGWLSCAKLHDELPDQKVIIVDDDLTPERERFAEFVGGDTVVPRGQGLCALIDAVYDATPLPALE